MIELMIKKMLDLLDSQNDWIKRRSERKMMQFNHAAHFQMPPNWREEDASNAKGAKAENPRRLGFIDCEGPK